jgi:hypothetical protein
MSRKALALDPDNPEALSDYRNLLAGAGRLKEALPVSIQLRTLEPFDTLYNIQTARVMEFTGQPAAAIALLESISPDIRLDYNRNVALATSYAGQGRYADAVNTLLLTRNQNVRRAVEQTADVLRSAPTKTSTPNNLPVLLAELNFVYAHVGALDRILESPERAARIGNFVRLADVWDPHYAPLRKTERFKNLIRKAGLVDYWRARGWADHCHPAGANDFACE